MSPDIGSTSPDPIAPDVAEGMGQARDAGLAAEALATTNVRDIGPDDPAPGAAEMREALGHYVYAPSARCHPCSHCGGSSQVPAPVDGDLMPRMVPCPWCSALEVSGR